MSTTVLLDSRIAAKDSANSAVNYIPPIQLDPEKHYEIGLISCTCWHSMANVKTAINDEFTFITLNIPRYTWKTLKIPQRAYNVTDLKKTIKEFITKNNVVADNFELTPNYNTLRARITLKDGMLIDFSSAKKVSHY